MLVEDGVNGASSCWLEVFWTSRHAHHDPVPLSILVARGCTRAVLLPGASCSLGNPLLYLHKVLTNLTLT
ncbi:hypothetical protein NKR23_g9921 [Pleurostoma richardsiae]|uniref:Uncharacterized protein n=1 Tax=Pleurostoma richardsiae TaxID=41990 RepID=A0AA38VEK4_9PEZI|nr:hypothetical protein NKR23_g9921 [Pleurostoma richardsiae]